MEAKEYYDATLKERYYKITHKSGLDVYVFPKKMTSYYALFGTEYGSVDNCFKLKGENGFTRVPDGIAHYLEHRMFTQKDGSDITERFSACGADSNAYTSFNKTVYLCSGTENFEDALGALVSFVTEPYFTEELVEKERGIIIQEIKMTEDSPYSVAYRGLLEAMYESNSVRVDIAGSVESVSSITADMLNKCYDTFYTPGNMALVVCGDVSCQTVMDIVDKSLPKSFINKEIERDYSFCEPSAVYKKLYERHMEVSKPIFNIGIKDNCLSKDSIERMRRFAAMAVLCELIFSRSGELYEQLFESRMITPDFNASYMTSKTFAYTIISGEADDPSRVLEYIKEYIKTFKYSDDDLTRCKRVLSADFIMDFDSCEEIANNIIDYVFEGFELFDYGHVVNSITREEIDGLINEIFKEEYFSMSVVYPMESEIKDDR